VRRVYLGPTITSKRSDFRSSYPMPSAIAIDKECRASVASRAAAILLDRISLGFAITCLAAVGILYSILPAVPSGDGPVHLYFAMVYRRLLGADAWYGKWYAFRHVVQPYSFHYLLLSLLESVCTPARAETAFVILTLALTWLGLFRTFSSCGRRPALYPWIVPLAFTWSLAGGFYNFCLGSAFAFHALACWISLRRTGRQRALVEYCMWVALLVLAHPIPLLLLAMFTATETAVVRRAFAWRSPRLQIVAAAATWYALVAPALVYNTSQLNHDLRLGWHRETAMFVFTGQATDYFSPFGLPHVLYRVALLALPCCGMVLSLSGVKDRFRRRAMDEADCLAIVSLVVLVACCFLPTVVNGSNFLARRLAAMTWPLLAIAVAIRPPVSRIWSAGVALTGMAMSLVAIATLASSLPRLATQMAAFDGLPLPPRETGVFLESDAALHVPNGSSYGMSYWIGVRAFLKRGDVLANSPWMEQTIVPLREKSGHAFLGDSIDRGLINSPTRLYDAMKVSAGLRDQIASHSQFILYYGDDSDNMAELRKVLSPDWAWNCEAGAVYALCVRRGER
jgi:hypothetical protein